MPPFPPELLVFKKIRYASRAYNHPIISYEEVKKRSQNPSPVVYLIDIRQPVELKDEGEIPNTLNMPLSTFIDDINLEAEAFKTKFGVEKPKEDQEVTIFCLRGVRSVTGCDIAKKAGYTNIYDYSGSYTEWLDKEADLSEHLKKLTVN